MVTYIYFVKCPNCEDEHFDFFDEAKEFALGCLSQKPIITQTEVNRNDFGECTDSADLGTVWSWEDVVGKETDAEPITFDKDDIGDYDPDNDPEFQDDDFRMISEELLESRRISFNNKADQQEFFKLCKETGMITGADLDRFMQDYKATDADLLDKLRSYKDEMDSVDVDFEEAFRYDSLRDKEYDDALDSLDRPLPEYRYTLDPETGKYTSVLVNRDQFTDDELKKLESCERKPIPEGMTIEQLVEAMQENEDTVECAGCEELFSKDECFHKEGIGYLCGDCEDRIVKCTWCKELYDKSECRWETGFKDWLCGRCEAAIKSRGETLTFRENNYWDFLDEDTEPAEKKTWLVFSGDSPIEIGEVYANTEEEAVAEAERKFPDLNYNDYDGAVQVVPADEDLTENLNEELSFSDMVADSINHLTNDLGKDPMSDDFADLVIKDIEDNYDVDFPDNPEDYRAWASEVASEVSRQLNNQLDEDVKEIHDLGNEYDGGYPAETPEVSDSHLKLCPECGKETFDNETGICVNCGFN